MGLSGSNRTRLKEGKVGGVGGRLTNSILIVPGIFRIHEIDFAFDAAE